MANSTRSYRNIVFRPDLKLYDQLSFTITKGITQISFVLFMENSQRRIAEYQKQGYFLRLDLNKTSEQLYFCNHFAHFCLFEKYLKKYVNDKENIIIWSIRRINLRKQGTDSYSSTGSWTDQQNYRPHLCAQSSNKSSLSASRNASTSGYHSFSPDITLAYMKRAKKFFIFAFTKCFSVLQFDWRSSALKFPAGQSQTYKTTNKKFLTICKKRH